MELEEGCIKGGRIDLLGKEGLGPKGGALIEDPGKRKEARETF